MQLALIVSSPGGKPCLHVDDDPVRTLPVAGLFDAVCWALNTFPAAFGEYTWIAPEKIAGRPELLNRIHLNHGEPGALLFLAEGSRPFHFFLSGLTLHTGPDAVLKAVLEGVAYSWGTSILEAVHKSTLPGTTPPGEMCVSGWPFRVNHFCRFLADSTAMTVRCPSAAFSPASTALRFQETRNRHARLSSEMGGCFSVLADIEKDIT